MNFSIVGDPHVTNKSLDRASELFKIVEDLGNPAIWTGDLLDTKEVIRGKCLNSFFDYFRSSKLNHIVLVGNHDYFNLSCEDHSLRVFNALPNVIIVDDLLRINDMYFVPYIHDLEKLNEVMRSIPDDSIVFGHSDVVSFDYGNGQLSDKGLQLSSLSRFKRVIYGHYHAYQQKDNLTFIGSPFSHSFGESDQIKYIGIYDNIKNELSLLETPMSKHVTLKVELSEDYKKEINSFLSENKNNKIRVFLYGKQSDINLFDRSPYEGYGIKWVPKPLEVLQNNSILEEGTDNVQQFIKWANDIKKLDSKTLELGLQILESVSVK